MSESAHACDCGGLSCHGESDDRILYAKDPFMQRLDSTALATIETVIGGLVVEDRPVILDLMAAGHSHIPESIRPERVVGLGVNEDELSRNGRLAERLVHDLNADAHLPSADDTFDVVLCTAAVDYLTRPAAVFGEVARVLKPGGLFLVLFSNRFVPQRTAQPFHRIGEEERVLLVADYFNETQRFEQPRVFVSRDRPRPADDELAASGLPSDPIYAVYADRRGGAGTRRLTLPRSRPAVGPIDAAELQRRKRRIGQTLRCPHCEETLEKWAVPDSPFVEWPSEYQYICFNNECPYYADGWGTMATQGNICTYRFMFDPPTGGCHAIPVLTPHALREHIVAEV